MKNNNLNYYFSTKIVLLFLQFHQCEIGPLFTQYFLILTNTFSPLNRTSTKPFIEQFSLILPIDQSYT